MGFWCSALLKARCLRVSALPGIPQTARVVDEHFVLDFYRKYPDALYNQREKLISCQEY